MDRGERWSIALIDLAGGGITTMLLVTCAWLGLVRYRSVATDINELHASNTTTQQDLINLRAARDRQQNILDTRKQETSVRGQLPDRPPVEAYMQALARLASENHLNIIAQQPLPQRVYPGLTEQRYAYEVAGTGPDLIRFLARIEQLDFWCDVSFLSIERARTSEGVRPAKGTASLTLSLFSAPIAEKTSGRG